MNKNDLNQTMPPIQAWGAVRKSKKGKLVGVSEIQDFRQGWQLSSWGNALSKWSQQITEDSDPITKLLQLSMVRKFKSTTKPSLKIFRSN